MTSVIVFSKDRPMQLHAYIESLLHFSDISQSNITVLYRKTPDIDYSRVIREFPTVKFIEEENFRTDLDTEINRAQDHIMFGCDDVVFTNHFNVGFAEEVLDVNEQIFGFSFRLGLNIAPFPSDVINHDEFVEWNWSKVSEDHYNYPWELCATLYRKTDVIEILSLLDTKVINPNYLEGNVATEPLKYIKRANFCCLKQKGNAIAITVNRVQDTHCNPVDSSMPTDIHSLNKYYNDGWNKLNFQKISSLETTSVHVGSDFFILEKIEKDWKRKPKLKSIKANQVSIKTFFKNICYLFRYNIKKISKEKSSTEENPNYIHKDQMKMVVNDIYESIHAKILKIKDYRETISELVQSRSGFCRYGDGEFILMKGGDILFQKSDAQLAERLKKILISEGNNILIGIPQFYFNYAPNLREPVANFMFDWVYPNKPYIRSVCNLEKQYYDTACSQMYASYQDLNFAEYFEEVKKIWINRDITIICGATVFDNIENNIFSCAKTIEYQHAPSKNAYSEYDKIFSEALKIDQDRLIIIILGPTATVLAYDLSKNGYQAIDFGHIAKDYDYYTKKVNHCASSIHDFFMPD